MKRPRSRGLRLSFARFGGALAAAILAGGLAVALPTEAWAHAAGGAAAQDWQARLDSQLHTMHRAVARYRDFSVAKAEGWRIFGADAPAMGEHWNHKAHRPQAPGEPLDLSRPLNLIYSEIDGRRELVGLTFGYRLGPHDPLPEGFAGSLDLWHAHDFADAVEAATEERPLIRWLGRRWLDRRFAPDGRTRLAMVHVWLDGANPDGPFAMNHRPLAYRRLGLGPEYWRGGSVAAAKGAALAHPDGCDAELDGKLWVADVERPRRAQLKRVCQALAQEVRAALGTRPAALNRVAEAAWQALEAAKMRMLTPREHARIAAFLEHGPDGETGHGAGHGAPHGAGHLHRLGE